MKKILLLAAVLFFASCVKNQYEVITEELSTPSTKITPAQAIDNLNRELKFIDGNTRAESEQRVVRTIKPLKSVTTRNSNGVANDLLYIVEFEEGQGSAIVAADTRLEPVVAVLDNSVLTEEDFASTDAENISVYTANLIKNYAETTVSRSGEPFLPAPGHTVVDTIYSVNIPPMTKTKWHQSSPYNDLCKNYNGESVLAGCAAIAVAQYVYYHRSPDIINGYNVHWNLLEWCEYDEPVFDGGFNGTIGGGNGNGGHIAPSFPIVSLGDEEAAKFVYNIGTLLNIHYQNGDTGAAPIEMEWGLADLGYNSTFIDYNLNRAKEILSNNSPVIMGGYTSSNLGHAWLLDGWKQYIIRTTTCTTPEGQVGIVIPQYTVTEESYDKVHANFGWEGKCDGYYTGEIFNCAVSNYDTEPNIGDRPFEASGAIFNTNLKLFDL